MFGTASEKTDHSAAQPTNTARAVPHCPKVRPAICLSAGCERPNAISAADASAPSVTVGSSGNRAGLHELTDLLIWSMEKNGRNEAIRSSTAAPITAPSPRVRERMFTSGPVLCGFGSFGRARA